MSIRSPRRWLLAAALLAFAAATPGRAAEPPPEDLEALQKKMLRQLLAGNPSPDELRKMVTDMNKLMLKEFPELQPLAFPELLRNELQPFRVMPLPPLNRQPPVFPQPFPRRDRVRPDVDLPSPAPEVTDKQLKEFDELIEKLKDNPDAQAELRKARDEYKKALEEGLRKGDPNRDPLPADPQPQAIQVPPPPPRPPLPRVERQPIDINVPVFPERGDRLLRPAGPVRLGVIFETPSEVLSEHLSLPARVGVVVVEVQAGSPAEKAGLRPNDVVVKLGGKDAPSELARFQEFVAELKGGEKLEAEYYRKGKKATAQLELAPTGR